MEPSSLPIRVVIVGGGRTGTALLEFFARELRIEVMGVIDHDPHAPGFGLARHLGIAVASDVGDLQLRTAPDVVVNATHDATLDELLRKQWSQAEILGTASVRLIRDLVRHERELRHHLIQSEKMATIGTLVSGISHEINNPLYIMIGFSEHLRDETEPTLIREYVDAILQAGKRIATILRDLNAFAQRPQPESLCDVDINHTLEEAVKMARRATIQDDLTVITKFSTIPPIRGKPEEILQLFLNLVTNAVQSMEGRGTLTLTTTNSNGYVVASVNDTGHGIPQNHLPRIFDPFFTTKEPGKGPGLGLHIVRDIVTMYGGEVTADSTLGQGATFTVRLPGRSSRSPC
jgi:two-component system NtrC family sensor kinase